MDKLKLRIKVSENEFEAEGTPRAVTEQFALFRDLVKELTNNTFPSQIKAKENPAGNAQEPGPPLPGRSPQKLNSAPNLPLHKLFTHDPTTSQLTPRVISPGRANAEETILLLLLGCRELKNQLEVPALQLNRILKLIGGTQSRLDRVLADSLKKQWLLKSGRGKGGKYRLTTLGIEKAQSKAQELAALIPDEQPGD
ncbi:hypothetical protein [Candidatus Nitronereus thalassa]|uniref:Uncharacterized protein n=1 Tax=Candidatus Nitronereus thalassa TaxID=3020898 RepID=A0ABU3K4I2_9BACT|nr:hypothetical protein [Candidatus Nitronereus thalassa]MDT7041296.1 hypothetical protein [Candidatus Nitronereus thalassa]